MMKTLMIRSRWISGFVCLTLILTVGPVLFAQETGTTKPTETPDRSIPSRGDVIYLRDQSGRPVPVPKNALVQEYLEWLEQRESEQTTRIPDYDLVSLSITGAANHEIANLQAKMVLRVRKTEGAVRVPLKFHEAVLRQVSHEGPGEFAFIGLNNRSGYEWSVSGEGLHELSLQMSVKLSRQLPMRRLQLSLPPSPVSSLELSVDVPNASFKVPDRSAFELDSSGSQTFLTLFGLTENLDLSWQSAPKATDERAVLQSNTVIRASVSYDNLLLRAQQEIEAVAGTFQQLEIRLPTGYRLENLKVDKDLLESISAIESQDGWYRLQLSTDVAESVQLDWILSRELPDSGGMVTIDGFELGGDVQQQSGQIHFSQDAGYQLQAREPQAAFRIDVPETEGNQTTRSWEFYRVPFLLEFDVRKIRPLFEIKPDYQLSVDSEFLVWVAAIDLSVYRGSLTEFMLKWPNWQQEKWQLSSDDVTGLIDRIRADESDPDILHLEFSEPLVNETQKLTLIAKRPLNAVEGVVQVQLPGFPQNSEPQRTKIFVEASPALEVTIGTDQNLTVEPLKRESMIPEEPVPVAEVEFAELASRRLRLKVENRKREVTVTSDLQVEVTDTSNRVRVTQTMNYRVNYEPLKTLRLRMPENVIGEVKLAESASPPLTFTQESNAENGQARIEFEQPQLGEFAIQFGYEIEVPQNTDNQTVLNIPYFQASDAAKQILLLRLDQFLISRFEPEPEGWEMVPDSEGSLVYRTESDVARQELRLHVKETLDQEIPLIVRRTLHRSSTDGEGVMTVWSRFLVAGKREDIRIKIPQGYEVESLEVNGQLLSDVREIEGFLKLPPPLSPLDRKFQHQVKMELTAQSNRFKLNWVSELACDAPRIMGSGPHQETLWLLELPYRKHLFVKPDEYAPLYRWQRQGVFWVRQSQMDTEDMANWIEVPPDEMKDMFLTGGNFYLFHAYGDQKRLSVGAMDRSVVVLAGAGLTLLMSFVLLRLPVTRNAITILILASGLAVVGVIYPTSVALLLQPAVLGFCLACLAAFLDRLLRRPQLPSAVVTFEEPSRGSSQIFQTSHPSLAQMEPALGSEDPTEMKQRPITEEQVSSFISDGE